MKIVILDGYTLNPGDLSWEELKKFGDLTVLDRTNNDPKKVIKAIGDAEIIFTNKTIITKEVIEKVPSVKYIGVLATGYNIVDVKSANELGIIVTNIPAYSTDAVAQFTFALILELTNQVGIHSNAVKQGEWVNSIDFSFTKTPLIELNGKTLGIIGFGRIGQAVAKIAQAFGLKVMVYSNKKYLELESENFKNVDLNMLLSESDIISLHCPLTERTEGLINKESIKKMKDGVMIINTSRGPLIVEEDLKNALNSGKVSGAGVDVVSAEPIKASNPLLKAKNCIITPHIAWAPKEARTRLMDIAVSNLDAFLKEDPINVIES
jgi:glycerate dehydrogenase